MARATHTAIVLGADIEALAAAATLADTCRTVHVVSGADRAGDLAAPHEIHPGHVVPGLCHETGLTGRALLSRLQLERHGLEWEDRAPVVHVRRREGPLLALPRDAELHPHLGEDAAAYRTWRAFLQKVSGLVRGALEEAPPGILDPSLGDLFGLARHGWLLRALGKEDMLELLRIAPLPGWDWMQETFRDPALRAGLLAPALPGTRHGPRAAGTSLLLALRECALGPEPKGGAAAVLAALIDRCSARGVQVHLGRRPLRLLQEGRRVTGVELEGGERLEAPLVVSALSPRTTLLELVAPGSLARHVEHEVEHWRARAGTAVVLLAFGRHVELECDPPSTSHGTDRRPERIISACTPTDLERAADALKYGELPAAPWLDIRIWKAAVGCTLCVHVHGVPFRLRNGWTDAARATLLDRVHAELARVTPAWGEPPLARELFTPPDLEERCGAPDGHLFGGDLDLDQLWFQRPSLALAGYHTPIAGLYLAGSASHPGGPFLGAAGILGARTALAHG